MHYVDVGLSLIVVNMLFLFFCSDLVFGLRYGNVRRYYFHIFNTLPCIGVVLVLIGIVKVQNDTGR